MSNNDENSTSRLNPESKINEDKSPIIDSKEFILKNETEEYHIKIEINNKYIFFTLNLSNRIVDISYQNKYDLNAIVRLLNLIPNKYKDLNQVLKFIEKAYSMNKISIIQDEYNAVIAIKIPIGFEEEEYKLTLYKVILSNNEIINQIVKELNNLKKIVTNGNNYYYGTNVNTLNSNNNAFGFGNNMNINDKINELYNKINSRDAIINELNKKMNMKDKEIKDIYSKLRDRNYLINEMSKTIKSKDNQILFQDKERNESINQLKIKDEEINKKLNEKAYELNNKLIDKDNALNEINKKLIEKDYVINEINSKLNEKENEIKRQNETINELKRYINKTNEDNNNKINELKNIIFNLEEVKSKYKVNTSNYNFNNNNLSNYNNISSSMMNDGHSKENKSNPQNLKFKEDIVTTNTKGGLNDIFEVYTSIKDNMQYLVSPNKNNFNLDIITLIDNKLQYSLKSHTKKVTSIRYFLNNFSNIEYLISSDEAGIVNVWDISNNFNIKNIIDTKYNDIIYSCLLVFAENNENVSNNNEGYIITSTYGISDDNEKSGTKIYSMENNGEFVNYISNTNNSSVYYLLSWYNKKNNKYYIIEFSYMKIFINSLLENEMYAELTQEQKLSHYSGFVYEIDEEKCYLYSSSKNGFINVWDLYNKQLINNINVNGSILCHMIQWDEKYAIVADYNCKSFKIIDIQSFSVVKDVNGSHSKEVKTIKKIKHPLYGDSLLSAGNDYTIKLWCI